LEIAIDRALPAATAELREQLEARPAFFRGSRAAANFGAAEADRESIAAFRDMLAEFGITLDGVSGVAALTPMLEELELAYLGESAAGEDAAATPRPRAKRNVALSDAARSLVADFAGARADLAARRIGREAAAAERRANAAAERRAASAAAAPAPLSAVPAPPGATPSAPPATPSANGTASAANGAAAKAPPVASAGVTIPAPPQSAPVGVSTLYHRGTLRGGQTLHNLGNIIVIGDVNPGAELIASGDIVVFGSLRGVAHAGAQGDGGARVVALELAPTQLRIATKIAAPEAVGSDPGPKHAYILGDHIAVVPHAAAEFGRREVPV
jgi:septum site-determining protein MinC